MLLHHLSILLEQYSRSISGSFVLADADTFKYVYYDGITIAILMFAISLQNVPINLMSSLYGLVSYCLQLSLLRFCIYFIWRAFWKRPVKP